MPFDAPWSTPPPDLALAAGAVELWLAGLDQPALVQAALAACLSADEQARATRYHFERDRRRFVAGRGILRSILARYLGQDPARLRFVYGPQGKPALEGQPLQFNLAHSGELALYAVARELEPGVDLEQLRPIAELEEIARRFFAPEEVEALLALPPERRGEGFFCCWTRKEAFIKANGAGLSMPLDQFAVALEPEAPARLLHIDGDPGAAVDWTLRDLPCPTTYRAALAVRGELSSLSFCSWDGLL